MGIASLMGQSGGGTKGVWIYDLSAYTCYYDWSGDNPINIERYKWGTVLDISGEGYLSHVKIKGIGTYNSIKITIDGVVKTLTGSVASEIADIYFKTSLKIEIYETGAYGGTYTVYYTYFIKNTTPDITKNTILDSSTRSIDNVKTQSITLTNVIDITGSGYLEKIEFMTIDDYLSGAKCIVKIIVDGVVKMNGVEVLISTSVYNKNNIYKLIGSIRFNTSLKIQHAYSDNRYGMFTTVHYALD